MHLLITFFKPWQLLYLIGLNLVFLGSCTSSKSYYYPQRATRLHNNNTVVVKGPPTPHLTKHSTQLIFQGKNNLLEVMLNQQATSGKGASVVIIKGNGNIIKIDSVDVAQARLVRKADGDTLVIMGNQQRFLVKNGEIVVPPGQDDSRVDTLQLKTTPFSKNRYLPDFMAKINSNHKGYFAYFNAHKTIRFALEYFIRRIEKEGDAESYFEMAEMYREGNGTNICLAKAIELYEHAAVKKHVLALRRLGDFYFYGIRKKQAIFANSHHKPAKRTACNNVSKSKKLAKFYYTQGQQLGDPYCNSMLNQFD